MHLQEHVLSHLFCVLAIPHVAHGQLQNSRAIRFGQFLNGGLIACLQAADEQSVLGPLHLYPLLKRTPTISVLFPWPSLSSETAVPEQLVPSGEIDAKYWASQWSLRPSSSS